MSPSSISSSQPEDQMLSTTRSIVESTSKDAKATNKELAFKLKHMRKIERMHKLRKQEALPQPTQEVDRHREAKAEEEAETGEAL